MKEIYTVSELTERIKQQLESSFPSISLQGEVSNLKKQSSGHIYFSLKDSQAQISAVLFRGQAALLKIPPKDGDQVTVTGSLNVYPPSGRYQLIVRTMTQQGLGALLIQLEKLKKKLLEKGYFLKEHKKKLPFLPQRIGVVTSPTGAVIQDIIHVLQRRFPNFSLLLNPVRVQGAEAAKEIAEAINFFNQHQLADVIIVGRGGGSLEDLFAFNEEIVADAIFKSHIPIVAAVGHETDHTIAEYVADIRAPTPSAAAEIVMPEKAHLQKQLDRLQKQLIINVQNKLNQLKERLNSLLLQPVLRDSYAIIGPYAQRLDDLKERIDTSIKTTLSRHKILLKSAQKQLYAQSPMAKMAYYQKLLNTLSGQITLSIQQKTEEQKKRLSQITRTLTAIDPKNLLKKGYALLFAEKDHSVITSIHNLNKKDNVRITLADGSATSTIQEIFIHDK